MGTGEIASYGLKDLEFPSEMMRKFWKWSICVDVPNAAELYLKVAKVINFTLWIFTIITKVRVSANMILRLYKRC